ncbi:hypothetical protein H0X48_00305 [Candidatus Dependentiae bacterium]|nr:hypothetical protein [Candidatus Dependentiae bacterium]
MNFRLVYTLLALTAYTNVTFPLFNNQLRRPGMGYANACTCAPLCSANPCQCSQGALVTTVVKTVKTVLSPNNCQCSPCNCNPCNC